MYPVGLLVAFAQLAQYATSLNLILLIIVSALVLVLCLSYSYQHTEHDVPSLPGFFLFNVFPFFRQRFDFIQHGLETVPDTLFRFRLLRNHVVVVSGERGRRDFFNARSLDLQEGFRALSGALPFVQGVTSNLRQRRIAQLYRRLAQVQKNERLAQLVPDILSDSVRVMTSWGAGGACDPFEKIHELVFQISVRCLSATEIADDPLLVARLRRLYDDVDRGTTPTSVLFPFFPGTAMVRKARATKAIYDIVVAAINVRRQSGKPKTDSLQMLLDEGEDDTMVVGFIMGLLIAGARSTGTTASWMTIFLGCHPHWQAAALAEVRALVATHGNVSTVGTSLSSLADVLSSIPLSAWEHEVPILDSIIRETLRIAQPHVAMRRNVGPDLYIDGKVIPSGTFVVYPFADVHLDPRLYPDPWGFDPARVPVKDDFSYVGWGGGRVNCLGTRLAKVEMKNITALLLLGFEFTTVGADGTLCNPHPRPNWNDVLTCRPNDVDLTLRYTRRRNPL